MHPRGLMTQVPSGNQTDSRVIMESNLSQPPAPARLPALPSPSGQCGPLQTDKCRLNVYTQRYKIPLPEYFTVNEGDPHQPKFRSSVKVNGRTYYSPNTFTHLKSAEQHAAKIAMDDLESGKREQMDLSELTSVVQKFGVSFKLILNEYAVKRTIQMPSYHIVMLEGSIPAFRSSLVFNGVSYTGDTGRSKRDAEQLAARVTVTSLLDDPDSRLIIKAIIQSKLKLCVTSTKMKDTYSTQCDLVPPAINPPFVAAVTSSKVKDTYSTQSDIVPAAVNPPFVTALETSVGPHCLHHVFNKRKPEEPTCGATVQMPISFVPAGFGQPVGVSSFSGCPPAKKKRKNKKKKSIERV